ncbi:MAG: hypothetical protein AAGE98_03890 [Actinomycetota bacterium]
MTEPTEDPEQTGDPALPDGPLPVTSRIVKSGTGGVTVLSAAMLAVGEILEPEKAAVEIAEQADDQTDVLDIEITFGDLPPIDEL